MIKSFHELMSRARSQSPVPIVVAAAEHAAVLGSLKEALSLGLVKRPILTGNSKEIEEVAQVCDLDLKECRIVPAADHRDAAAKAVAAIAELGNGLLMKGILGSGDLLRAVLDKETGLRTGNLLSHVGLFQAEGYDRIFLLTDGGINISPDLSQKAQIAQNAVTVARALDIERPRIAALAAIELVNHSMQATVDAACLAKMAERGQISGAEVDGPLALDNAVSPESALTKQIASDVAGKADILLVPEIVTGNVLYKSLVYFARCQTAGIVAGARVPIVLTSRADSEQTKLHSIALGALMANYGEEAGQ